MSIHKKIKEAVSILQKGGLVAFPTETVYGLGADAFNEKAVEKIFKVKGRPAFHPLIVHAGDKECLHQFGKEVPDIALKLAETFWPGPLTVIVKKKPTIPDMVTGGLDTVGLRVPHHPLALELLQAFGGPIAAPSANRFGAVSPTTADHVSNDLSGLVDLILDGGSCRVGVESTIIDCTSPQIAILRPGGISCEEIEKCVGHSLFQGQKIKNLRHSGQFISHYAPQARVILVPRRELANQALKENDRGGRVAVLTDKPLDLDVDGIFQIIIPEDPFQWAFHLYDYLRLVDQKKCDVVIASLPPPKGIGFAIIDRLQKAAGPKN